MKVNSNVVIKGEGNIWMPLLYTLPAKWNTDVLGFVIRFTIQPIDWSISNYAYNNHN